MDKLISNVLNKNNFNKTTEIIDEGEQNCKKLLELYKNNSKYNRNIIYSIDTNFFTQITECKVYHINSKS